MAFTFTEQTGVYEILVKGNATTSVVNMTNVFDIGDFK
jgi:hypothetical protein